MTRQLRGHTEPRIFTPPLRPVEPRTATTEKHTLGYAVIDFANDVLGVSLYPWQEWLLIHALELLDDGNFRFRKIVVLVARQQGKSTLSQVLSLFFMYVLGTALVIGTAQDLDVAEEIWQGSVDLVEENPELDALKERVVRVNGKKSLELKTGERYKVKAANRRAGRGLSGDLVLLDELREHQSWQAWAAITGTTNARPNAQIWALSNAGDISSVVLRYLRKMAHKSLGDPDGINANDDPNSLIPDEVEVTGSASEDVTVDASEMEVSDDTLGIFEWSAKPGRAVTDREGWCEANPSLGYGSVTERTLASAAASDPEWEFRTEVLCQWAEGTLEGPFPAGAWEAGQVHDPELVEQIEGQVIAGVATARDRSWTCIVFAGLTAAGRAQIELVQRRAGTDWVKGWLTDPKRRHLIKAVTGQGRSAPESGLLEALRVDDDLNVEPLQGSDLTAATGALYDAVRNNKLTHLANPALDVPAATAVPKVLSGGASLWDTQRSPTDISGLRAATAAYYLLDKPTEVKESAYADDHDLIII